MNTVNKLLRLNLTDDGLGITSKITDAIKFELPRHDVVTSNLSKAFDFNIPAIPFNNCYFECSLVMNAPGQPEKLLNYGFYISTINKVVSLITKLNLKSEVMHVVYYCYEKGQFNISSDEGISDEVRAVFPQIMMQLRVAEYYINYLMDHHFQLTPVIMNEAVNAKRLSKGKKCFYSHYKLDINLTKQDAIQRYYTSVGKGTPKRLHARRGHVRRLPSGKLVEVKGSWCGNKELGVITKDYRIKYEH